MIRYFYKKHKANKTAKEEAEAANFQQDATIDGAPALDATTQQQPLRSTAPATSNGNGKPTKKPKELCAHRQQQSEATVETGELNNSTSDFSGKCPECAAEKRAARIYRWKLIVALLPLQFLASTDLTIVATATTTIASHFDQLQQFNWIVTAYTLTSTAFIPAYGQIADIWGRHAAIQISMVFMIIGSTLAAAAQTWAMLLLGRAFQGLSAAGILNMIKIVLSDKVSLADNAKNNTVFALVAGLSYAAGPVIGGYIADSNWRYCFVISIPAAILGQVLVFVLLRKELVHGSHHATGAERHSMKSGLATFDFGGTALFVIGTCLLILGVTSGGTQHPWKSYQVLVPLIIGAIMFTSFFYYEYLLEPGHAVSRQFPSQVAMIPWKLFERKDTFLMIIVNAATGAALYSAFYFVGIFWTVAEGESPGKAGTQLLYYTPGIGIGVYAAMFICNIFPRQTFYPLFLGSLLEGTGFAVLAWATNARSAVGVNVMMAISGAGTGLRFMPNNLHVVGNWPNKRASAMSLMDFSLPFGGTLAIAIMSSVFYNTFTTALADMSGAGGGAAGANSANSLQGINSFPKNVQDEIRQHAARSVMWSFVSVLPIMAMSILAASMLGNVWINKSKNRTGPLARGEVLYGSFLLAVFTGRVKSQKEPVGAFEDELPKLSAGAQEKHTQLAEER